LAGVATSAPAILASAPTSQLADFQSSGSQLVGEKRMPQPERLFWVPISWEYAPLASNIEWSVAGPTHAAFTPPAGLEGTTVTTNNALPVSPASARCGDP